MSEVIIGVDPGADGAVVVFSGMKFLEKHTVPKETVKSTKPAKDKDGKNKKDDNGRLIYNNKKVMDESAYFEIFKTLKQKYPNAHVFLELVKSIGSNPRQASVGATQNFNFGYNFGLVNGFIISCEFASFTRVTPQEWQKKVVKLMDHVYGKEGKNDNKASALKAFLRIFPNEDMRATSRSSIFHDGLVDAGLLCYYGYLIIPSDDDDL